MTDTHAPTLDTILADLRKHFCATCQVKPTGFLRVRNDKEVQQAIDTCGLSRAAIHALRWVLFQRDDPRVGGGEKLNKIK
jgi:hypothetical protein